MAGVITEDYEASSGRSCQSWDSIAEWRSSEQVENGTPSTSPLYWDTDDDDCGPKPSELFRRFTWKIDNFSTINRRELRSNAFEVCGYKWYILIYPQGCDVCNHLSLFLCVANHDKLLPGWSHFAQFTIAVINKDPKKTKYSDTLHRFWKKEHDWGWKKFMELSKVYDGFVNADTLVIKAQVQVIREKAHRPFRCLECQYRRELVRIYLSNVEQICRHFIEEKTVKFSKLIEDKSSWLSFRDFWLATDPNSRWRMSRDKTDAILKVVVKHFFIEKEVTSTLVMDSLYSGLKVLECQSKNNTRGAKFLDLEKLPSPMVHVDEDMFVLADDVLLLLERTVREPLPHQPLPQKDDKCFRTKDGSAGEEFSKDTIERDERRLMELGRRTVEIFVLFHIFSSIEVAHQESVALVKQEELIREEEAACHAENELRAKRGGGEKDKRSKKKQAKQKRNSRKGKDKGKNDVSNIVQELSLGSPSDSLLDDFISKEVESVVEQTNTLEDASDVSDSGNVAEVLQPDFDDRDASPINWDTDVSEVILSTDVSVSDITSTQLEKRIQSALDDSSSTCSTDSVPSVVINGPYKRSSLPNNKIQCTPNRGKNNQNKVHNKTDARKFSCATLDAPDCGSSLDVAVTRASQPESDAAELSLKREIQRIQKHTVEKDVEVTSIQKELDAKDQVDAEILSKSRKREPPLYSPVQKPNIIIQQAKHKSEAPSPIAVSLTSSTNHSSMRDSRSSSLHPQGSKLQPSESKLPQVSSMSKSETLKHNLPGKSFGAHQASSVSRPTTAPFAPAQTPRRVAPVVSSVQSMPLRSRSVTAAGRLGTELSPSPSYVPQSYRNAIIGKSATFTSATSLGHQTDSSNQSIPYSHPSTFMASPPVPPPSTSVSTDQISAIPTFGFSKPDALNSWQLSRDDAHAEDASSSGIYSLDLEADIERLEIYGQRQPLSSEIYAQGVSADEFPHLDIINDLLNDENNGRSSKILHHNFSPQYSFPPNNSLMDFGSYSVSRQLDHFEQHYDDVFQSAYASSSSTYPGLQNGHLSQHPSQPDLSAYANCQIEGMMPNQWPYGQHPELSYQNWGNGDTNGYTYPLPDYSSLLSGINGYMYRPSSGP